MYNSISVSSEPLEGIVFCMCTMQFLEGLSLMIVLRIIMQTVTEIE
jgi:hypothetical protein